MLTCPRQNVTGHSDHSLDRCRVTLESSSKYMPGKMKSFCGRKTPCYLQMIKCTLQLSHFIGKLERHFFRFNQGKGKAESPELEVAAPWSCLESQRKSERPEWLLSHTLLEKVWKPLSNQSVTWCSAPQDNQGEKKIKGSYLKVGAREKKSFQWDLPENSRSGAMVLVHMVCLIKYFSGGVKKMSTQSSSFP